MCVCVCVCVFVCVRVCLSLLHYVQAEAMRNKRKDEKFQNADIIRERKRETERVKLFAKMEGFFTIKTLCVSFEFLYVCVCVCACACTYVDLAFGLQLCSALILCTLSIRNSTCGSCFMGACVCV